MKRLEITPGGEAVEHELTAEEEAAIVAARDVALVDLQAEELGRANEMTLRDRAENALANLQAAYDGWAGLSVAQKDAALKLNVRVTIALVRLVLRRLDNT